MAIMVSRQRPGCVAFMVDRSDSMANSSASTTGRRLRWLPILSIKQYLI